VVRAREGPSACTCDSDTFHFNHSFISCKRPTIKWFNGLELAVLCFVSQTVVRPTLKVVPHPGHCATAFARTQAIANKVSGHLPHHHLPGGSRTHTSPFCHSPCGKRPTGQVHVQLQKQSHLRLYFGIFVLLAWLSSFGASGSQLPVQPS
jgi:hypothetical protein